MDLWHITIFVALGYVLILGAHFVARFRRATFWFLLFWSVLVTGILLKIAFQQREYSQTVAKALTYMEDAQIRETNPNYPGRYNQYAEPAHAANREGRSP